MRKKTQHTAFGEDILSAVRKAYPGNLVTDDVIYDETSYYDEIRDEVREALSGTARADLSYARPPEGRLHWHDASDLEEDAPDCVEELSSYGLFFLALRGEEFQFAGELEEEDWAEDTDDIIQVVVPTIGRIGCAVGVSIVAPFAVIRFTEMETAESGSVSIPDIWTHVFTLDGDEFDVEAHYAEWFREEGIAALRDLRTEITRSLDAFGIRILSDAERRVQIPGLKLDAMRRGITGRKIATVDDALFFRTI